MNWFEKLDEAISWAMTLTLGSAVGGVGWLVRRLFTNQQEIAELKSQTELLRVEFARRDSQRAEDREDLQEVKASVRRIEDRLMR